MSVKSSDEHIRWIDFLRAFSICCVVLCHAAEKVYDYGLDALNASGIRSQTCAITLFTIGRGGGTAVLISDWVSVFGQGI